MRDIQAKTNTKLPPRYQVTKPPPSHLEKSKSMLVKQLQIWSNFKISGMQLGPNFDLQSPRKISAPSTKLQSSHVQIAAVKDLVNLGICFLFLTCILSPLTRLLLLLR